MFRHLGWFIGPNYKSWSTKSLPDAKPRLARVKPVTMLDTVQEIAIYIHRFHNLDLFQQGWYQIKISIRWEDSDYTSLGTPARVVQYEAPDLGSDDIYGVWRIDDTDNSFSTQPFRIKYARQDVLLSILISFNLSLGGHEGPPTSAVILKFELMYVPAMEKGSEMLAFLDAIPAAVHEFRIPPKALLGLHSYCPVHFDAFHAVLVDVSIHTSLLKYGSSTSPLKVPSDSCTAKDDVGDSFVGSNQALGQVASVDLKQVMLVKALLTARDTLLEELLTLSRAIGRPIDLTDFISKMDDMKLFDSVVRANPGAVDGEVSGQGKPQNGFEKANGTLDFRSEQLLRCLSRGDLLNSFHSLGDQISYLWNTFLKFHRANERKILEFLRDAWAKDRRAEWSIWMVYSKVEMPHHYINSGGDESSPHGVHKRVSSLWKLTDDPAQAAAMRAVRHRRSISQMNINNRSIQDMHIFGNPSNIPIVIVERVMNAPRRSTSENSYLRHLDMIDSLDSVTEPSSAAVNNQSGPSRQQGGRVLKIVVFVHGFQQKTLARFRHIILLSSPQDGYVPYHSARIESCQAASWDSSKKCKVFLEMLNNCLDQMRTPSSEQRVLMRCDVNFDMSSYGKNLNTFIGRAAHIEFLESDIFARFILWSFPELFR
ncbi:uncharacterized protein LOC133865669 isoform X2 [Alnus glutinosa]|uniref:uncharacterized protein LOC133865669 isoform X2 n=1 Tax=Alnus glutinosa TaxID=3517 RepID=UPI002D78A252|nr:uncharacterized protein LOC133865669 isoform X2 [Alnus glutinosa]